MVKKNLYIVVWYDADREWTADHPVFDTERKALEYKRQQEAPFSSLKHQILTCERPAGWS